MNDSAQPLDRPTAAEYATWFKALADPTRIQIVSLLARAGGPLTVGRIVSATDVSQPALFVAGLAAVEKVRVNDPDAETPAFLASPTTASTTSARLSGVACAVASS